MEPAFSPISINLLQDLVNTRPKVELRSPFLVERQSLRVRGEAVCEEGKESWCDCLLFYT